MSTADTALSISIKMAPGPEHRQEPVAPDKIAESDRAATAADVVVDIENVDSTTTGGSNNDAVAVAANAAAAAAAAAATAAAAAAAAAAVAAAAVTAEQSSNVEIATASFAAGADPISQSSSPNSGADSKQLLSFFTKEEPATLSGLNEGELRALLDEAITYKCPKDREGKSNLFKELLQEAEADETEEGRRVISNSRCLPGSNRRRHKRESVSERLTHGGSLQNLAQPITSEFDSSFAYLTSNSCHTYGSSRRKNKKYTGPSVSARQREGGSLPSNVNASHSLASLANLDLIFDKKKSFCEERSVYDWTNKEKSKSLDKSSYISIKKEDKEKEKKESKRDVAGSSEGELETREKRLSKGKYGINEMLESDNPPPEYKSDYMVIDLGDVEVGAIEKNLRSSIIHTPRSLDDEGTELKILDKSVHYVTRATFDVQTPVDTTIEFPIREQKQEKSKISVNSTEMTSTLSLQTNNSVKCGVSSASNNSSSQDKIVPSLCSTMSSNWQTQNTALEGSKFVTQHIATKDSSSEKKSFDENGNTLQAYNGERKKPRRKHTQEYNVTIYSAENVKGHRNIEDIDSLINFIENKESTSKKGKTGNPVKAKTNSSTKSRTREKDTKPEQLAAKSNSLEEISKLEDLTTEKSISSSGASSVSSQHDDGTNMTLRSEQSTGDMIGDNRGDLGTEEGQSMDWNDSNEDSSCPNSSKKVNLESEHETEFLVVTKKKKNKKQRGSNGSRTQNLTTAGSYLPNSREFTNKAPELRRKSAGSMPTSDKSADSSDLDSVRSVPVTSNSSKPNLSKVATSSGNTPRASYADIARMSTINMSNNLKMSVPHVPKKTKVASKTPPESEKGPEKDYPSLNEIQERKVRSVAPTATVYNTTTPNWIATADKFTKKNSLERKKVEAREEKLNKNYQVFRYVQDVEKMLTKQEDNVSSSGSDSTVVSLRSNITIKPTDADNNSSCINNKDPATHVKANNSRSRRIYVHSNQNIQTSSHEEQHIKKVTVPSSHNETPRRSHNPDVPQTENKTNPMHDCAAENAQKSKNAKPIQESPSVVSNGNIKAKTNSEPKTARVVKECQNTMIKHDTAKNGQSQTSKPDNQQGKEADSKSMKPQKAQLDKDQLQRQPKIQTKKSVSRPAVILLDETSSDIKNNLAAEFTFGFEINEQLLLEDSANEEAVASPSNPTFSPSSQPHVNQPAASNFNRTPPLSFTEQSVRYDYSANYHLQPPNAHMMPMHPVMHGHGHHVMMPPMPYVNYSATHMNYPPQPTYLPTPLPAPRSPQIIEDFHPSQDFSVLYVAPPRNLNLQAYNHDKIVSFVGQAWDAVMREMPATTNGRVQFYNEYQ